MAFVAVRTLVGHRVVGHASDGQRHPLLLTRGDGTLASDPPVALDRVLGEVTDWHDGRAWRPVPPAPTGSAVRRLGADGLLLLVRTTLAVDRNLAARLARLMSRVEQRLSPRDRAHSSAEGPGVGRV